MEHFIYNRFGQNPLFQGFAWFKDFTYLEIESSLTLTSKEGLKN